MKRIGILGGTFDPVHNGHLFLAANAKEQFGLEEVWLMPSPDPPHKKNSSVSNFDRRFRMTELAVCDSPGFCVSDFEIHLPQPSYSAKTLEALRNEYPEYRFYFIIGEDSLDHIETWYHPETVMALATLIVAVRKEEDDNRTVEEQISYLKEKYHADILQIVSEEIDISSTEIRDRIKHGKEISGLVPEAVERYIWKEKLYIPSEKN